MHKLLVNALSVTNPSGRHVLLGHLNRLTEILGNRCGLVVICRKEMEEFQSGLTGRVEWIYAPACTVRWWRRAVWERIHLPRLARRVGAFAYFTPNGMAARGLNIPQLVFAQNPWALVPSARRRRDAVKAWLQRRAYRRAMREAAVMIFNSRYMQQAYRKNAGVEERRGVVVYQAADESTHIRAAAAGDSPRRPEQILTVSIMAPHKNIEALLCAFCRLRETHPQSRLVLAGSWPDPAYEWTIRTQVTRLGLGDAVEFTGFVTRERLDQLYAESRIFCLMSRCESFGIPAIEAQLFGTPVVTSTVCAMPEIGGEGGLFCDPDDIVGIVEALKTLIEDDPEWRRRSQLARENADRFEWSRCSRPLIDLCMEMIRD